MTAWSTVFVAVLVHGGVKGLWLAALVAGFLLAGCAQEKGSDDATAPTQADNMMRIEGIVQDDLLRPVGGARVALRLVDLNTTTDEAGRFVFDDLPMRAYLVDVAAPGFLNTTLTAEPQAVASLSFVLRAMSPTEPFQVTQKFDGILQCALEVLIVSPSCDSVVEAVGGPSLTEDTAVFEFEVSSGWRTLVIDVDFDPEAQPGLDGLRVKLAGAQDANSLGTYDDYGAFAGQQPFTVHVEPGQKFPDGTKPVPENQALFRIDGYPHSYAWHATCDAACFLGAGFGLDVQFTLYVTAWYVDPAPTGWSFLAAGA